MSKRNKKNGQTSEHRDAQLRRRMLNVVRLGAESYANGFVPFNAILASAKDDSGLACDGEDHAAALIDSLKSWHLLDEAPSLGLGGTRPTNQHRRFKLTNKAWELWTQSIPPIPGVADDRLN